MSTDVKYSERLFRDEMADPEFRREYDRARTEIDQVDAIVRALDLRRQELELSKAELARMVGKNPAVIRRLFSSSGNPELLTVAALVAALGGELRPVFGHKRSRAKRKSLVAVH